MEIPTWQFAPDFYKYVVGNLTQATGFKLIDNYEAAWVCLLDIYYGISEIIVQKDIKLHEELEEHKTKAIDALHKMNSFSLQSYDRAIEFGEQSWVLKNSINSFHEKLMKGAYISGILIPRRESENRSGHQKFRDRYIKPEVVEYDDMDNESGV